jgi:ubiquinol-cytochrome c reductase cytochrome b subunit
MHLIVLHDTAGSSNPLGVSANNERIPFAPYYLFKDLITIFAFIFVLSLFVFFMPNVLGDSENYVIIKILLGLIAIFFAICRLLFLLYIIGISRSSIQRGYSYILG